MGQPPNPGTFRAPCSVSDLLAFASIPPVMWISLSHPWTHFLGLQHSKAGEQVIAEGPEAKNQDQDPLKPASEKATAVLYQGGHPEHPGQGGFCGSFPHLKMRWPLVEGYPSLSQ